MRKSEVNSLVAGVKIQSKKDSTVYEIVGMDAEAGKYILTNGKTYSTSTMIRWFDLYVEPQVEDNTEEQTNTSDLQDTDTQDDQLHEDNDKTTKKDVVEANIATNSTGKTNTVQPTIQQRNLMADISNLVDLHGANLIQRKEYIGVYKEGYKGCIAMIRRAKYGTGIHIDMKQKIWNALDEEYRQVVSKDHYTGIYDKSRRLQRIGYVNDLSILEVIICTALQIAQ